MENKFTQLNCNFDKKSYEKLNSQFAKVRIRIAYDGLNRNDSIIPKDILEKMSKTSIFNIPIVGEYSEENKNFLGHGGKLEISDEGFKFIDTTRPYGVVPSDTEIYWEKIPDKNGYDEHEYLCCTGILWHGRYPEIEKILDDGANQSMEIQVIDGEYTDDNKFLIKDAEFSALCILGKDDYHAKNDPDSTNVEPCFEDACISKYSSSNFKTDFALMLEQYGKFSLDSSVEETNLNIKTQTESIDDTESDITNYEEETNLADKTKPVQIDKEKVFNKLKSVISETKFRSVTDKHYEKWEYLSHTDTEINLIDREDAYRVYSIPYLATETDNEIIVNVDYDNKQEKSLGIVDKTEDLFNIQNEVEMISLDVSTFKVAEHQSTAISKLSEELEVMTENYSAASDEIKRLTEQLGIFQKEKEEFSIKKKIDSIKGAISIYNKQMPKCTEFLEYCMKIEENGYKDDIENVEKELDGIYGRHMLNSKSNAKFSAIEANVIKNGYLKAKEASYDKYDGLLDD